MSDDDKNKANAETDYGVGQLDDGTLNIIPAGELQARLDERKRDGWDDDAEPAEDDSAAARGAEAAQRGITGGKAAPKDGNSSHPWGEASKGMPKGMTWPSAIDGEPPPALATDPPVSEAQRKALQAAAHGHSTLGIPKSVGEEFVGKKR